jgi:hypothetical protein
MLTRDLPTSSEGRIPHHRFGCQELLRPFLDSLKEEPRTLSRISSLGSLHPDKQFETLIFAPDRILESAAARAAYWRDFDPTSMHDAIVFFDPDNGFETDSQRGPKWLRHDELKRLFLALPPSSAALVYQHRPRQRWEDVLSRLAGKLDYLHTAVAVYESGLAFVGLAGAAETGNVLSTALRAYALAHQPAVRFSMLVGKV